MFELKIDTGNAAFVDDFNENDDHIKKLQIIHILKDLCGTLHTGQTEGTLTDINGNTVGEWKLDNRFFSMGL